MPGIKKKFINFKDYAGKQVQDIFPAEDLKSAVVKKVTNPSTKMKM